jgi:Ca2+-binding EF-hand superfamily protein
MKHAITRTLAAFPLGLVAAAALAFAPGGASAFDPTRDDYSPDDMPSSYFALKQMKPMDVMHQMDADKDGYVTKAEFMKYMESLYARMDRNHDGKVSSEEWLKNIWNSP